MVCFMDIDMDMDRNKMLLPMIDLLSIHVIQFLIDSLPLDSVHKYLAF